MAAGLALAGALPGLDFACGLGTLSLLTADVVADSLRPQQGWLPVPTASPAPDQDLLAAGVDAVLDDREERPGVKFKDAELTGIPFRLTVGSRDLADGLIEITSRASGEKERVAVASAVDHLRAALGR